MTPNLQIAADTTREAVVTARPQETAVPPRPNHRRYKRAFDLTVIVLAHVALLPLWALLWILIPLAIWLGDRGAVFYTQERLGLGGRRFRVIKFRTMVQDAEAGTGPVWASEADSRATAVGCVLRKLHLDETPQLLNVLRGEMSLVGPRPERPVLAERFSPRYPRLLPAAHGETGHHGAGATARALLHEPPPQTPLRRPLRRPHESLAGPQTPDADYPLRAGVELEGRAP